MFTIDEHNSQEVVLVGAINDPKLLFIFRNDGREVTVNIDHIKGIKVNYALTHKEYLAVKKYTKKNIHDEQN